MNDIETLEHYGKLGMHWGKRSAATKARAAITIRPVHGKPTEVIKRGSEGLIRLKPKTKRKFKKFTAEEKKLGRDAALFVLGTIGTIKLAQMISPKSASGRSMVVSLLSRM